MLSDKPTRSATISDVCTARTRGLVQIAEGRRLRLSRNQSPTRLVVLRPFAVSHRPPSAKPGASSIASPWRIKMSRMSDHKRTLPAPGQDSARSVTGMPHSRHRASQRLERAYLLLLDAFLERRHPFVRELSPEEVSTEAPQPVVPKAKQRPEAIAALLRIVLRRRAIEASRDLDAERNGLVELRCDRR